MPSPTDIAGSKALRRELNKRMIDITGADLRVMHGVAYIKGVLKGVKGGPADIKAEIEIVAKILRQKGYVKEVISDAVIRNVG